MAGRGTDPGRPASPREAPLSLRLPVGGVNSGPDRQGQLRARGMGLGFPPARVLSHAWKVGETWEGIFGFETKLLPYGHYRRMAVCSLPREGGRKPVKKKYRFPRPSTPRARGRNAWRAYYNSTYNVS